MNEKNPIVIKLLKRSLKYVVHELKDRDDYEVRFVDGSCTICKKGAAVPAYRFSSQQIWKTAILEQEVICNGCKEQKEIESLLNIQNQKQRTLMKQRLELEYFKPPIELENAGFKNFVTSLADSVLDAKKISLEYVKNFSKEKYNLLFMGTPGTGKTHLATAISRTIKEQGFIVGQLTTGQLLTKIRASYDKGARKTEEDIFTDLRKIDLLILDDLGSEAKSKDEFDWSKNKIFEIINHRSGKPTIYTTNFNLEHLPTAIGERSTSRIYNNTRFVELATVDYRKKYKVYKA